jgi:hypothetical protein
MDNFDLKPEKTKTTGPLAWNILTIVTLVGVLCLGGYFLSVFINPNSALNPFPPPVLPTLVEFPTATWTPIQPPATWTPTPTLQPSPTRTEAPTWTPVPSNTPFFLSTGTLRWTPTRTPMPSKTPKATSMPVTTTINYLNSTIYHPEAGCNWFGVAGQAVDKNNAPIMYLTLHLGGTLDGKTVDYLSLTGTAPDYGVAGFEFRLGDKPVASNGTLWIQVLDQAGQPLTDRVYFDTFASCEKNLVLFRFKKTR